MPHATCLTWYFDKSFPANGGCRRTLVLHKKHMGTIPAWKTCLRLVVGSSFNRKWNMNTLCADSILDAMRFGIMHAKKLQNRKRQMLIRFALKPRRSYIPCQVHSNPHSPPVLSVLRFWVYKRNSLVLGQLGFFSPWEKTSHLACNFLHLHHIKFSIIAPGANCCLCRNSILFRRCPKLNPLKWKAAQVQS